MHARLVSLLMLGFIFAFSLLCSPLLAIDTLSFLPEQNEFKLPLISSPDAFIEFHLSDYRYASQLKAEILIATGNKEAVLHAPYSEWIIIKDKESANVYIPVFSHTNQFEWNWKEIKFKKLQEVPFAFMISDAKFVAEVKALAEAEPVPLTFQDFESPAFELKNVQILSDPGFKEKKDHSEVSLVKNGRGAALKLKNKSETLYFVPFIKPFTCGDKQVSVEFWSKAKKFWVSLATQEMLVAFQNHKKNKIDFTPVYFEDAWKKETLECLQQKNILGLLIDLPDNAELMLDQIRAAAPQTEF